MKTLIIIIVSILGIGLTIYGDLKGRYPQSDGLLDLFSAPLRMQFENYLYQLIYRISWGFLGVIVAIVFFTVCYGTLSLPLWFSIIAAFLFDGLLYIIVIMLAVIIMVLITIWRDLWQLMKN